MISKEQIEAAVDILVREARPERVILFGSYARGDATPDSDLDLLVVEREVHHQQAEMARLRRALSPLRIPVDLLVTDTERLSSSWADFPGTYLYDAVREGKVLYAVDRAGTSAAAMTGQLQISSIVPAHTTLSVRPSREPRGKHRPD